MFAYESSSIDVQRAHLNAAERLFALKPEVGLASHVYLGGVLARVSSDYYDLSNYLILSFELNKTLILTLLPL